MKELCSFYCRPSTGIQNQITTDMSGRTGASDTIKISMSRRSLHKLQCCFIFKKKKTFSVFLSSYSNTSGSLREKKCCGNTSIRRGLPLLFRECFYYFNCSLSIPVRPYLIGPLLSSSITSQKSTANKLIPSSKQPVRNS